MKKFKTKYFIFILLSMLIMFSFLLPHFEDLPVGARIAGLNNCATALGDDIFAYYFNPAALENLNKLELGMDYNRLHLGLTDGSNISSSMCLIGKKFKKIGGFLFGYRQVGLVNYYIEREFSLGFGREINIKDNSINLGTKINILSKEFKKTLYTENAVNLLTGDFKNGVDPVFSNGYYKMAVGLDFGLIYEFLNNHRIGVLFENINEPNIGIKEIDVVERIIKFGYLFKYHKIKAISDLSLSNTGIIFALSGEREINILPTDKLFLRGGLGFGNRGYSNLSLGISFVYRELFQFDYGFNYLLRGLLNLGGSHQISLLIKF